MKHFLLSAIFLAANCTSLRPAPNSQTSKYAGICCPLIESDVPINFSAMKTCITSKNNLYDVVAIESVSGKPDRKFEIHYFKDTSGLTWLEKCHGGGTIETISVKDTSMMQLVRRLENKHYDQLCTDYNSSVSVINLFEFRQNGKTVFSYALEGSELVSVCEDDKKRVTIANQIFQSLKAKL